MKYELIKSLEPHMSFTEQIFYNRGVDASNIEDFLHPPSSSIIDPYTIKNIETAAETLFVHLHRGHKIFIQVDSDCDGYTSSAILLNWLYRFLDKKMDNIYFRIHDGKQHGLLEETVQDLKDGDYRLVIIPDAGSNQNDIHEMLYNLNIDCIILDHHESDIESETAIVVNPTIDGGYSNKSLSGAAVVYKFCKILDDKASTNFADDFLDLVSLGLIADMMDTTELETRRLILLGLNNIKSAFLKALFEKQAYSMRNEINTTTVSFYIAPLINAVVRAGTMEEKETIFKAFLEFFGNQKVKSTKRGAKPEAEETIAELACRIVSNIKTRQNKMRDESIKLIEEIIQEQQLNNNKIIAIVDSGNIDRNLSGLIANKLMAKYKRPVIILKETSDNMLQGSARGYEKSELKDFKSFINNSEIAEYAEGHANAFGVGFKKDNLQTFINYSNSILEHVNFDNQYLVDYIFDIKELKSAFIDQIYSLRNLWGKGFEEPLFCIKNIKIGIEDITLLSSDKNPTLKITVNNISFMKFNVSLEEYGLLKPTQNGSILLDVVGRFQMNDWNGTSYPQVLIDDYIKIKDIQYYF
jgi:single-stranded-DNA-specific exonuclease